MNYKKFSHVFSLCIQNLENKGYTRKIQKNYNLEKTRDVEKNAVKKTKMQSKDFSFFSTFI